MVPVLAWEIPSGSKDSAGLKVDATLRGAIRLGDIKGDHGGHGFVWLDSATKALFLGNLLKSWYAEKLQSWKTTTTPKLDVVYSEQLWNLLKDSSGSWARSSAPVPDRILRSCLWAQQLGSIGAPIRRFANRGAASTPNLMIWWRLHVEPIQNNSFQRPSKEIVSMQMSVDQRNHSNVQSRLNEKAQI